MANSRGSKRCVYVNGIYCQSMAEAARKASVILDSDVELWEIQEVLRKRKTIKGLVISEKPPVRKSEPDEDELMISCGDENDELGRRRPLLRYPHGEHPLDRGIGRVRP